MNKLYFINKLCYNNTSLYLFTILLLIIYYNNTNKTNSMETRISDIIPYESNRTYNNLNNIEYFENQNNNKQTEQFENSNTCKNDCKCVNYNSDDPTQAFCGHNDPVLGLVACNNCDDTLYQQQCKQCIPAKSVDKAEHKNIVKYDDKLIHSQYSTNTLENEEIIKANKKQAEQKKMYETNEGYKLYNLSIATIATNLSKTTIDIINDLFDYTQNYTEYDINKIMYIFTKENRSIYIGIIFVMLSLILYFIDVTN
jgi:hypothetical protein